MDSEVTTPKDNGIRWWLAVVVLIMTSLALGVAWFGIDQPRQSKNIATAAIFLCSGVLWVLWWLVFSRIPLGLRLGIFAVVAGVLGVAVSQLTIVGVSGDLVPVLGWKHASRDIEGEDPEPDVDIELGPSVMATDASWAVESMSFEQFLGPERNTQIPITAMGMGFLDTPPEVFWKIPMGKGWSGFVVQGGRALTQEQQGKEETLSCYALGTGELLWRHRYPSAYESVIAGDGPRATPTISGERVLSMGSHGMLSCVDLATGELRWSHDVLVEQGGKTPEWGFSPSPLVMDQKVIVPAGEGARAGLVVYDLETGALLQSYPAVKSSYSSPMTAQWGDDLQIIYFYEGGVAGFDVKEPDHLWDMPWGSVYPDVAVPLILPGQRLLISSGYGVGSALLQLEGEGADWSASLIWKGRSLKAKFSNVAERDGFVYGLDDGIMVCIDLETGKRQWKEGRYGHGQLLMLEDVLLVTCEDGRVIWMTIDPVKPNILAEWQALDGKCWNPPCLAWPFLILRNDREAVCYALEELL